MTHLPSVIYNLTSDDDDDDNNDDPLKYFLVRPSSLPLLKKSTGAAGFDLHADLGLGTSTSGDDLIIPPNERMIIGTGVVVMMPAGTYGRIAPTSGLALEFGIDVLGGVIDNDYRGEIKVILVNSGDKAFTVHHGARIAELILEKIANVDAVRVHSIDSTPRGARAFGSRGAGPSGIREVGNWQHGVYK